MAYKTKVYFSLILLVGFRSAVTLYSIPDFKLAAALLLISSSEFQTGSNAYLVHVLMTRKKRKTGRIIQCLLQLLVS